MEARTVTIIFILFFLLSVSGLVIPALAQGDSMSNAEQLTVNVPKNDVWMDSASPEQWYKFQGEDGVDYTISVNPDSGLWVTVYIYDDGGGLITSFEANKQCNSTTFTVQMTMTYYIKLAYNTGSGHYDILVSDDGSDCCNSGGGGGDNSCPLHKSCHICIPGTSECWDPCDAITTPLCAVYNALVSIKNMIVNIGNSIKNGFIGMKDAIVNLFTSFKDMIVGFVSGVTDAIASFFTAMKNAVIGLGDAIYSGLQTIANGVKAFLESIIDFFKTLINGIIDGLKSILNGISNGLGSSLNGLKDWISDNGLLTVGAILLLAGLLFGGGWLAGLGAIVLIAGAVQSGMLSSWALVVAAGLLLLALSSKR